MAASAQFHECFIQPTDAADGEKTGPAAAEPAVQEEQEENRVSVNDGMHLLQPFYRAQHTMALLCPLHSSVIFMLIKHKLEKEERNWCICSLWCMLNGIISSCIVKGTFFIWIKCLCAETLSARVVKRENTSQHSLRLFQIWNKCINKWFPWKVLSDCSSRWVS